MRKLRPQIKWIAGWTVEPVRIPHQEPRRRHSLWKGISINLRRHTSDTLTTSHGHQVVLLEIGSHVGLGTDTQDPGIHNRGGWTSEKQLKSLHVLLQGIHSKAPGVGSKSAVGREVHQNTASSCPLPQLLGKISPVSPAREKL